MALIPVFAVCLILQDLAIGRATAEIEDDRGGFMVLSERVEGRIDLSGIFQGKIKVQEGFITGLQIQKILPTGKGTEPLHIIIRSPGPIEVENLEITLVDGLNGLPKFCVSNTPGWLCMENSEMNVSRQSAGKISLPEAEISVCFESQCPPADATEDGTDGEILERVNELLKHQLDEADNLLQFFSELEVLAEKLLPEKAFDELEKWLTELEAIDSDGRDIGAFPEGTPSVTEMEEEVSRSEKLRQAETMMEALRDRYEEVKARMIEAEQRKENLEIGNQNLEELYRQLEANSGFTGIKLENQREYEDETLQEKMEAIHIRWNQIREKWLALEERYQDLRKKFERIREDGTENPEQP